MLLLCSAIGTVCGMEPSVLSILTQVGAFKTEEKMEKIFDHSCSLSAVVDGLAMKAATQDNVLTKRVP